MKYSELIKKNNSSDYYSYNNYYFIWIPYENVYCTKCCKN